ncbi:PleD family two-component system response regulator [Elusimicrobiota bacterium]
MVKKVLFIDDDKGLVRMMRILFKRRNFDFYTAGIGQQGIEMADEVNPDVIILDIGLPDMKGFEVCKEIKERKKGKQIPIIFVTGQYFGEQDREKGFKMGADDFLIKPFDQEELLTRISIIMEKYTSSKDKSE